MKTESNNEPILMVKLTKDLKKIASEMDRDQARYLVSGYYSMQDNRIRCTLQKSAADRGAEKAEKERPPHAVLDWMEDNAESVENQIKLALKYYAESQPMGIWAMKTRGIGPVIAAALMAHIDIEKCPTVGHLWRFAGQDPTAKWEKGQKRPHNADLKVVVWKIGESFVKSGDVYRKIYDDRKVYEQAKNERGDFKEQADAVLKSKPTHAQAKIYKEGKLPPGQIHARARRYAAKMFLSHWWEQAWWYRYGCEPVKPFGLTMEGHGHYVNSEVPITKEKI